MLGVGFVWCTHKALSDPVPDNAAGSTVDHPVIITPADPTSVQRGIDAAARAGEKKVVIPPGTYWLPRIGDSHWHLRFEDLKNLEIDATGVTFMFTGRDERSVLFDNCEGVKFHGATFMRDVPPFSQGKIETIAADRTWADIRIDHGYPTDLDDKRYFPHVPVIDLYQTGTQKLKPLVPDLYIAKIERQGPDLFRFFFRSAINPAIPMAVGDPAAWRGTSGGDLDIWECSHMVMQDITIKNGTGLAFVELCGEGYNAYTHCVITYAPPPPGAVDQPLLACGTDGFHSASMRHGPTLEDCHFEGLNDDSVNIHGTYGMLMEAKGNTIVIDWRTLHSAARHPIAIGHPGDILRLYSRKGGLMSEAKIVSTTPKSDYIASDLGHLDSRVFSDRSKASYWEVVLDAPVSGETGGMVANPDMDGDGFVIQNCTFRNSRGHGIYVRAGRGIIKGCTIEGIMMGGIVVAPEMNSWNESDYAHNLIIEGNTIRNVGLGTQPWNSGLTVANFVYSGFAPLPGGHRNIEIRDNRFEDDRGPNIIITSAIGVKIDHNRFLHPMREPAFHIEPIGVDNTAALIWMRNADQVSLHGNLVVSPGKYFKSLIDTDGTVNATGLDNGVVIQGVPVTQNR